MQSLVDQQLWSNVLGYLAEDTVFYKEYPNGEVWNVGSQGPIDSYLCLRCASVRLCGIVTGPPLLDALEYAISYGHYDDDCERYQSILDSGWVNQVYSNVSLAGAAIGVHRVLYGDVLFMGENIPLGMQRRFFIEDCVHAKNGSPARWEIYTIGDSRSYKLVFGNFTGRGSGHFQRWHWAEWYLGRRF